ncbi:MAG: hypothetical protein PVJ69_09375 [Desulfobacteraceae bacterium]
MPDSADFDLGSNVASYLSRHTAVRASPACQYLIACLRRLFQGTGKSTLAGIVEDVDRAPFRPSEIIFLMTLRESAGLSMEYQGLNKKQGISKPKNQEFLWAGFFINYLKYLTFS